MRINITEPVNGYVTLGKAPDGSFGIDSNGNVFFCTMSSAACLTEYGLSYSDRRGVKHEVRLLSAGTKIEITV